MAIFFFFFFCKKKLDFNHTCLAVIILDSALKKNGNCYPQLFLKECEYFDKDVARHIHDNLSYCSSSEDECDEEKIRKLAAF